MDIQEIARSIGLVPLDRPIRRGDLYIAQRNTGPHLLTCADVKDGYVIPRELQAEGAYCYDLNECVAVQS